MPMFFRRKALLPTSSLSIPILAVIVSLTITTAFVPIQNHGPLSMRTTTTSSSSTSPHGNANNKQAIVVVLDPKHKYLNYQLSSSTSQDNNHDGEDASGSSTMMINRKSTSSSSIKTRRQQQEQRNRLNSVHRLTRILSIRRGRAMTRRGHRLKFKISSEDDVHQGATMPSTDPTLNHDTDDDDSGRGKRNKDWMKDLKNMLGSWVEASKKERRKNKHHELKEKSHYGKNKKSSSNSSGVATVLPKTNIEFDDEMKDSTIIHYTCTSSSSMDSIMDDIEILPANEPMIYRPSKKEQGTSSDTIQGTSSTDTETTTTIQLPERRWRPKFVRSPIFRQHQNLLYRRNNLPLSTNQHIGQMDQQIRQMALSISSNIDTPEQWKELCQCGRDGSGLQPLFACIHEAAKEIEGGWKTSDNKSNNDKGINDDGYYSMSFSAVKRESVFSTACLAIKTLRDLCGIDANWCAVVTDEILNADAVWRDSLAKGDGEPIGACPHDGGLLSDMTTLLRYANNSEMLYNRKNFRTKRRELRSQGVKITRLGTRRQRRQARRQCSLYISQLMLDMTLASDRAVDRLNLTEDLPDIIKMSSSYAPKERLRSRMIRYPIEFTKRLFQSLQTRRRQRRNNSSKDTSSNEEKVIEKPFVAASSVPRGPDAYKKSLANQLLAALGHNFWVPKAPNQKGLRILCLDGGGSRGILCTTVLSSIVKAMNGVEVADSFDIIAGTSTGAIIAFLVGLKRESSEMARKRYDDLIGKIFVKSALSTPMLFLTTASYSEVPFRKIMKDILGEGSMIESRADPRVPLVFALSSKMSSTQSSICLFRNYNYSGDHLPDKFVIDPDEARAKLGLEEEEVIVPPSILERKIKARSLKKTRSPKQKGSRHEGSFRVMQRAALRATTAAPTYFKPVLMGEEMMSDGGIVASNPSAVAIHEARKIYPNVPIELIVSCGTGEFLHEKASPSFGWDGIAGQIIKSATDTSQTHHVLEDILGRGKTANAKLSVSGTRYIRFDPRIGTPQEFPIDGTDPKKLEKLCKITADYMNEPEQLEKLKDLGAVLGGRKFPFQI